MPTQLVFRLSVLGRALFAAGTLWLWANTAMAKSGDAWSIGEGAVSADTGPAPTVSEPAPAAGGSAIRHSTEAVGTPQGAVVTGAPMPESSSFAPQPRPSTATPAPPPAASSQGGSYEYEDTDPSALNAFRKDLDPYGRWIDDSKYGRVWVPDATVVGSDFAPYVSNGRWALDVNNDWVWESNYPFGWVVFHYGRWVWIDSVGWSWVPGRRYAPAWVVWRVPTGNHAYVGWAPAPPTFVWYSTGVFWLNYYPPLPFVFCPSHYVFYPNFGVYIVRDRYFASTLIRSSVWYSTAPVYGRGYVSPPIDRARVPARFVPTERVSANPRAAAMSRTSANPQTGGRMPAMDGNRLGRGDSLRPGSADQRFLGGNPRSPRADSYAPRGNETRPASYGSRPVQSLGSVQGPERSQRTPQFSPRTSAPATGFDGSRRSGPSFAAPSRGDSPRFSAPGRSYSSPSFSAPSRGDSPRFSAPSRSYSSPSFSAPSRSYSSPSSGSYGSPRSSFSGSYSSPGRSFSSPSFSSPSFGGGMRGGGGSVRMGRGR